MRSISTDVPHGSPTYGIMRPLMKMTFHPRETKKISTSVKLIVRRRCEMNKDLVHNTSARITKP